jgi:hypothetical protein
MKHLRTVGAVAILLLAMAVPSKSMAQSPWGNEFQQWLSGHPNAGNQLQENPYQIYDPDWRAQHPELQEYIRNNPTVWNGMRSRGSLYYSERFNRFLNEHPNLKNRLASNPELVYDRRFRDEHPELRQFLQNHPSVWQKIARGPNMGGGGPGGWGDYDSNHQWRDANWWHENDRAWMYQHHPEWAENHPDWRAADGDFDDAHVWHDRGWWNENHRDWVGQHHPDWFKRQQNDAWKDEQHAEHEAFKDQQHAQHEASKDQQHAQHEAFKDQQKQEKHGRNRGGPGDHDNN